MRSRSKVLRILLAAVVFASFTLPAVAIDLGDIVKVFGIGYAVSRFGGQINSFVNTLLAQRGAAWEGTTKVVPILSVGSGGYIGAAQVAGPPELVQKVRAVAQVEITAGNFRGRGLIPIGSTDTRSGLDRVEGVGLSALIDFNI